jgi:hypothetical protein
MSPAAADPAGTPFGGRSLPPGPFAGDDGRPDPALVSALQDLAAATSTGRARPDGPSAYAAREVAVVRALGQARVFVAVVAGPGAATEMALLTATMPGGRRALPVFTGPETLARFRPDARPVPVPGPRAALSAVSDGCDLLHVDPAGPAGYVVRRPAVWALGQSRPWLPSYVDPVVAEEISGLSAELGLRGSCGPGAAAELHVELALPSGLDAEGLAARVSAFEQAVSRSEVVAERVDALEVGVTAYQR